ncbi:MAG: hypothetical protein RIF32_16580 [Leptospirales bacterium]
MSRGYASASRYGVRAKPLPVLLLAFSLVMVACDPGAQSESAASRGGEIDLSSQSYDTMPEVRLGELYAGEEDVQGAKSDSAEMKDARRVLNLMRELLVMLEAREIRGLARHVSPNRGLYVDLKAHRSHGDIQKDLRDPEGYLQTYYLNTETLRSRTEDPGQLAVRDILRLTRVVTADVYMQADRKQCELRLRLEDAPSKSYYLNNPVFVKENEEWFIYRLF